MMQKPGSLLAFILFSSVVAAGQQTPRIEIFGGYSHLFADVGNSSFGLNGFHASGAENLNSWFGGVLDFSSHYGTLAGVNVNTQSIMYGPRFAYRKIGLVTPSVHALFGAVHGSAGLYGISMPDTHFAYSFGGAVDVKVTDRIALRVVQADYLRTRFLNLRQDNVRVSAGLVFRFAHW
jgi:hypothetical protein